MCYPTSAISTSLPRPRTESEFPGISSLRTHVTLCSTLPSSSLGRCCSSKSENSNDDSGIPQWTDEASMCGLSRLRIALPIRLAKSHRPETKQHRRASGGNSVSTLREDSAPPQWRILRTNRRYLLDASGPVLRPAPSGSRHELSPAGHVTQHHHGFGSESADRLP